jgi:tRNA threonylcarbamoyladenosine biosynthesis protein TsaB
MSVQILLLETSGSTCSACISKDEAIIAQRAIEVPNAHSKELAPMVQELLQETNLAVADIDAIAISAGPGSYTGLRIGASLAKGMCYSDRIPLIAISTLATWASASLKRHSQASKIIALIDARRMDAYQGVFNPQFESMSEEKFITINKESIADLNVDESSVICGTATDKFETEFGLGKGIKSSISNVYAWDMLPLALKQFNASQFEDLVNFEPNYIKSVFVTQPKPKF